jgi:hypothetical protein
MSVSDPVRARATPSDDAEPRQNRRLLARPWAVFVVVLVLAFLNMAAWSLATPLFASPDEPAQVARAVALDHGQLIGKTVRNEGNAITHITIPKVYAAGNSYGSCFTFKDTESASCAAPLTHATKEIRASTYVGRYPPLYYAIVGLPSLFTSSATGIYAMRLVSALLNATFLALGAMSIVAWSRSRFLLIGLLVAATPMTFFLGGVVNPSGFEIAAAMCLWSAGLVLALERADNPPPGLVAVVTTAATALLLARALSPLWVACIAVLLAVLTGWRGMRGIARARSARWALVAFVPAAVFAVWWIVAAHALDLLPVGVRAKVSGTPLFAKILGDTGTWIQQMIGIFGWLDTLSPLLTYLIWYGVVGLLVLMAWSCAKLRHVGALLLLLAVVVFVPVAISYGQAHRLGIIWQARYIMPMAVGVPLMAVALLHRSAALRAMQARLATVICVGVWIGASAAFAEALRRYATGVTGPLNFLHGSWQPPWGAPTLTVAALVILACMGAYVRYLAASGTDPDNSTARALAEDGPARGASVSTPEEGRHVRRSKAKEPARAGRGDFRSELGL